MTPSQNSGGLFLKPRFKAVALLFEVFRTALNTLALGAFRNILEFSAFKQGFHDYLTATTTSELVCSDRGT